jgi:hypothetical protein
VDVRLHAAIQAPEQLVERIPTGVIPEAYWLPFEDPPAEDAR